MPNHFYLGLSGRVLPRRRAAGSHQGENAQPSGYPRERLHLMASFRAQRPHELTPRIAEKTERDKESSISSRYLQRLKISWADRVHYACVLFLDQGWHLTPAVYQVFTE